MSKIIDGEYQEKDFGDIVMRGYNNGRCRFYHKNTNKLLYEIYNNSHGIETGKKSFFRNKSNNIESHYYINNKGIGYKLIHMEYE